MSYAVGGDILEITYNHETLGSGTIFCKSAEDGTLDPGGYRSNDDANMISGNGLMIDQISRVRGSFETPPILWDMTNADELQKLAEMAASSVLAKWTINHVNGAIWAGNGKPVGDINGSTLNGTVTLKLAFDKLNKIS